MRTITLTPGTIESIVVAIALREYVENRQAKAAMTRQPLGTLDIAGIRAAKAMLSDSLWDPAMETRYCKCGERYSLSPTSIKHDNGLCYDCSVKAGEV